MGWFGPIVWTTYVMTIVLDDQSEKVETLIDNTKYRVILYGKDGWYPFRGMKTLRAQSKCIIVTLLSIVAAKYTLVIMIMSSLIAETELETYMLSMWVFEFVSFSPNLVYCGLQSFSFRVFISPIVPMFSISTVPNRTLMYLLDWRKFRALLSNFKLIHRAGQTCEVMGHLTSQHKLKEKDRQNKIKRKRQKEKKRGNNEWKPVRARN